MKTNYKVESYKPEFLELFSACLTPGDIDGDAARMKKEWVLARDSKNFGAQFAISDDGSLCGMIQYIPIQESAARGEDLWFVYCIWIPPKKRNPGGNQRRRGIGRALLEGAENDVRNRGAKGLAVWGTPLPFFMQSSFFKRLGYTKADKTGIQELLWKPFQSGANPPLWREPEPFIPEQDSGVSVTSFISGICPAMNMIHLNFKRAAAEFDEKVIFTEINTSSKSLVAEWDRTDAVFIHDREFPAGPPPSYKKIYRILKKAVEKG